MVVVEEAVLTGFVRAVEVALVGVPDSGGLANHGGAAYPAEEDVDGAGDEDGEESAFWDGFLGVFQIAGYVCTLERGKGILLLVIYFRSNK